MVNDRQIFYPTNSYLTPMASVEASKDAALQEPQSGFDGAAFLKEFQVIRSSR